MNDGRFVGLMVPIHEIQKRLNLSVRRNTIVGYIDMIVGEMIGDVFPVVELAAIDHHLDPFLSVDVENVGVWPPRRGDDTIDDPRKGLGSFWLTVLGPVVGANRREHGDSDLIYSSGNYCWLSLIKVLFHGLIDPQDR